MRNEKHINTILHTRELELYLHGNEKTTKFESGYSIMSHRVSGPDKQITQQNAILVSCWYGTYRVSIIGHIHWLGINHFAILILFPDFFVLFVFWRCFALE